MSLFKIEGRNAQQLNTINFKNEKDLQRFVENNVEKIFGFRFIETEFLLHGFRLDSVAFDEENKSFVIIEYKETEGYSVIDQGFSYLNLLLTYKGDFQLLLERKLKKEMEIDWTQSKIIFIAKSFSTYQQSAIAIQELPIELWKYSLYETGIINFEQLKPLGSGISIKTMKTSNIIEKVSKEIQVYNLNHHLKKLNETTKQVFNQLREEIMKLSGDVEELPRKYHIAYKHNKVFTMITFTKSRIDIWLKINEGKFIDPKKMTKNAEKYNYGYQRMFSINSTEQINDTMYLIKQAYDITL
jgi:predicted transport protein